MSELKDSKEREIIEILSRLDRVKAPKDFEFRLKARIASAKSASVSRPRLFKPAYVAFASLLLLLTVSVAYFSLFRSENLLPEPQTELSEINKIENNQAETDQIAQSPIKLSENLTNLAESSTDSIKSQEDEKTSVVKVGQRRTFVKRTQYQTKEEAISSSSVKQMHGISTEIKHDSKFKKRAVFSIAEILKQVGVETIAEPEGYRVLSIRANSLAEKYGIKANDLITAINGQKIAGQTFEAEKIELKRLTVKRNAEETEIVF